MTEQGTVTGILGRQVTVQLEMSEGCAGCLNGGCKTGRAGIQSYNKKDISVAEGDRVEISIEGKAQLTGAFWILGLPLGLLFAGYALGRFAFGSESEVPAVMAGIGALVLGMLGGVLVQKQARLESLPALLRKVEVAVGGGAEPDFSEGSPEYVEAAGSD
jgi:positive regulator of sigma E activity